MITKRELIEALKPYRDDAELVLSYSASGFEMIHEISHVVEHELADGSMSAELVAGELVE